MARTAGILAAKRTPDLIPLCHPLRITGVDVSFTDDTQRSTITVEARVRTVDKTGVEMEALTAAAVAGLTVYDMVKAVDKGVVLTDLCLIEKSGGKSGPWRRRASPCRGGSRSEDGAHLFRRVAPLRLWPRAPASHGAARTHLAADGGVRPDGAAAGQGADARPGLDRGDLPLPHPRLRRGLAGASAGDWLPHAARYGLGPGDNPIFPGLWEAAELVAGGSLLAAQVVADGEATRAFHFAGGLHHAMPDRASGFCYVNDAVLAIMRAARARLRVAYVDIDAHHGDGVQFAFYGDPDVLTISTHERGDRLFPGTGFVAEVGEGAAAASRSTCRCSRSRTTPCIAGLRGRGAAAPRRLQPDALVLQLGIDSHRTDPLTHLALTVQGFTRAVSRLLPLAPRVVALGGGGYDLPNVARAWTAAWAAMNDVEPAGVVAAGCHTQMRYLAFRR